jgi:lipid-binding SYLF domain-containing protein
MHRGIKVFALTLTASAILFAGCQSDQSTGDASKAEAKQQKAEADLEQLKADAEATRSRAEKEIANIENYYDTAAGYAIFPKVTKGGLVVGGAHGWGVVYERRSIGGDKIIGTSELTQGSVGFQIGGQSFSEVIFFEDDMALNNFKKSDAEFSGQASGVAGGAGATEAAKYENGVAIFVFGQKGLMGEASIGGQGFNFKPLD